MIVDEQTSTKDMKSGIRSTDIRSVVENADLLANILLFAASDIKDVPSIARTCKLWNLLLNSYGEVSYRLWRGLCLRNDEDIISIYSLCKDHPLTTSYQNGGRWKYLLRKRRTSLFQPIGVNQRLQLNFESVFSEEGIVAFSNCCSNCTDSYQDVLGFTLRDRGIKFFKLFLNGINYDDHFLDGVYVVYSDLKYLSEEWESECEIIRRWCAVIGLADNEYTIRKPKTNAECIFVEFNRVLTLEEDEVVVLLKQDVDEEYPPAEWMDWLQSFDESRSSEMIDTGCYC